MLSKIQSEQTTGMKNYLTFVNDIRERNPSSQSVKRTDAVHFGFEGTAKRSAEMVESMKKVHRILIEFTEKQSQFGSLLISLFSFEMATISI